MHVNIPRIPQDLLNNCKNMHETCNSHVVFSANKFGYALFVYSGGAYLPLDVSYPTSLMESVLKDAEPVAVVTSPDLADSIEGLFYIIRVLYLFKILIALFYIIHVYKIQ